MDLPKVTLLAGARLGAAADPGSVPHGRLSRQHPRRRAAALRGGAEVPAVHRHLGPSLCAPTVGCHSPSPAAPSSLCASFPFLTEKEARGSPRNATAEEMCFMRHREGQQGNGQQRGQGVCRLGRRPNTASSAAVAQQWSEWGNDQTAGRKDSMSEHRTASQARGVWAGASFHRDP